MDDRTDDRETEGMPGQARPPRGPPDGFPVVGIGSSAGGLDAVTRLLGEMAPEPGVAIVVVTHGKPGQQSDLVELLDRSTDMEVVQVREGMAIRRNRVHVTPPGQVPEVSDDRLEPLSADDEAISHAIDRFLRSLSDVYRSHAVGVVLSGSLSDGAQGLQAIQQRGGIAIVQDPETAEYPSMPDRAIEAGHVDHVLSPEAIAGELVRVRERWAQAGDEEAVSDETLSAIFDCVREQTGVDFSRYKRSTLVRRIQRRLITTRTRDLETYLGMLEEDPEEVWRLHDESLIHVTEFFRDPEVFEALENEVLPEIVDPDDDGPIRVWVPGCATGEEVYSLAILLAEHLEDRGIDREMQLFGTDLSESAIETAREARYPRSIADGVSEERLQRFFVQEEEEEEEEEYYRVREPLRTACVFARHDLLNDPPFSELNLVSCRNVLIYLHHDHQEDVVDTLHYSLDPHGALVLGSSESIQRFADLFETLDAEHNIYRPKEVGRRHPVETKLGSGARPSMEEADASVESGEDDLRREIDRVALEMYAPPAIVLDEDMEIVEFRGDVSTYLDPQEGQASLGLTRIAPHGLAMAIRSAVDAIREEGGPIRKDEVTFRRAGERREVSLRVVPVLPAGRSERFYLVAFEQEIGDGHQLLDRVGGVVRDLIEPSADDSQRVQELEEELEATRAYLQSVIEDYEATNEELRSAHEEALSTNEELQSTNEELETTKEELQSTNEELQRVNDELRERNREVEEVNTDLLNLLEGIGLPIVMVDGETRIRRFTPQAEELLGLIEADEGRPLADLNLPVEEIEIVDEIQAVIEEQTARRQRVRCEQEAFRLRITPYRTSEGGVDGAVLAFWDVQDAPEDA